MYMRSRVVRAYNPKLLFQREGTQANIRHTGVNYTRFFGVS